MSRRTEKLADLLQSTLAEVIQRRLKDPALEGGLLSLTRVEVAPNLATARVYVSVLSLGDGSDVDTRLREEGILEALGRAGPLLTRELARELRLRRVPRLRFLPDRSIDEASRVTALMRELAPGERDAAGEGDGAEEAPP